jgi:AbiV family abortive infection protein
MRRESRPLNDKQLALLAKACLANSVNLIGLSEDLLQMGHVPRAYSLAITAGEEFGKAQIAIGRLGDSSASEATWKNWWRVFYSHDSKLTSALFISHLFVSNDALGLFVSVMGPALQEHRREWGLYVDVVNGALRTPDEAISYDEARHLIDILSKVIISYATIAPPDTLVEQLANAADSGREMRSALESRDPNVVRRTWEATTGNAMDEELIEWMLARWEAEDSGD